MRTVPLPEEVVAALHRLRHLELLADSPARRRSTHRAMNRLIGSVIAAGWAPTEVGRVIGPTGQNAGARGRRGQRTKGRRGLAIPKRAVLRLFGRVD